MNIDRIYNDSCSENSDNKEQSFCLPAAKAIGSENNIRTIPPEDASPRLLLRMCGHYLYHYPSTGYGQTRVLKLLLSGGTRDQKDLQQQMGIRPASLSELLVKLEAKGFITREKSPDDKRRTVVHITDLGREAAAVEDEYSEQKLFDALSPTEQEQLRGLLSKLLKSWYLP